MKVTDFKFQPNCPPEILEQAKKWIKDNQKSFSSTTNYGYIDQDGVVIHSFARACHAGIGGATHPNRCVVMLENGTKRSFNLSYAADKVTRLYDAERRRKFIKWLTQESFFAPFFLSGDDLDFGCDYGFVVSADMPAPLLQNLCIISRHFYECGEAAFEVFDELTSMGLPPMFAYMIGFNSNMSLFKDIKSLTSPYQIYSYSGHRAWGLPNTMSMLKNLLAGEFGPTFEKDCKPKRHFRNFATIYGGAAYGRDTPVKDPRTSFISELCVNDKKFNERLKDYRKASEAPTDVVNPFKSKTSIMPNPSMITYKELIEVLVPFLKEESII